ncbi:DUF488 domain-containing protein [bacterium]|nr:DUF488 domain-containing protein [bacterium]
MPHYTVYTVGHGQLSWDEFELLIRPFKLEQLIDVRSMPYSELAPQFNRERLEHSVRRLGMEYLWLGSSLGPLTADGKVDYIERERESRYHDGIQQLLGLAHERRTALLGSQPEPWRSHRHQLIAQTLLRHDVEVLHILPDGSLSHAVADLFHAAL